LAEELAQIHFTAPAVTQVNFRIPRSCQFTYDASIKGQGMLRKNVYENYLSSAEPRTPVERRFEKFCEHAKAVEWIYRNGEKGSEFFSLVYQDGAGNQKLLFPDYLLGVGGTIWIVEAKSGFERNQLRIRQGTEGAKRAVLKRYLERHGRKGGTLHWNEETDELLLCMADDSGENGTWIRLEEIWG